MSVVKFSHYHKGENPLDEIEDMLEASDYSYVRLTPRRLSFQCEGGEGAYDCFLEWHGDYNAFRISLILKDIRNIEDTILEAAVEAANESAWHGFFMRDGAGHIVFKSLQAVNDDQIQNRFAIIEGMIDKAIEEGDRLYKSLPVRSLTVQSDMLSDDNWDIENMMLAFTDVEGNA